MTSRRKPGLFARLKALIRPQVPLSPELQRAMEVLAAVDAGGIPLNPGKINAIARSLGLEVSRKAPMEETIRRLRAAVERERAKAYFP